MCLQLVHKKDRITTSILCKLEFLWLQRLGLATDPSQSLWKMAILIYRGSLQLRHPSSWSKPPTRKKVLSISSLSGHEAIGLNGTLERVLSTKFRLQIGKSEPRKDSTGKFPQEYPNLMETFTSTSSSWNRHNLGAITQDFSWSGLK